MAGVKGFLTKIFYTYPTMAELGKVIPYLKKIHKIYKSHDTHHEFYCLHFNQKLEIIPILVSAKLNLLIKLF